MKKSLFSLIYFFSIIFSIASIQQVFAERTPAVGRFTEIDIENSPAPKNPEQGYPFTETKRLPAGVTQKNQEKTSYVGPFIFLLALPFSLWLLISKKLNSPFKNLHDEKNGFYPKTYQFKPYKTDYQKNDDVDNDEDSDYPKAS